MQLAVPGPQLNDGVVSVKSNKQASKVSTFGAWNLESDVCSNAETHSQVSNNPQYWNLSLREHVVCYIIDIDWLTDW